MASYVHATGFSNTLAHLNGTVPMGATRLDLALSLLAVGYVSRQHSIRYVGPWRAKLLLAMVRGYITPHLRTSQFFQRLEQSEKVGVSFLLGQAFTHCYAQKHMGMQFLLHVQGLHSYGHSTTINESGPKPGAVATGNGSRPDFIGFRPNEYHVFESKGRTRNPSAAARAKALGQVSKIAAVNGAAATTRCATFLVLKSTGIQGRVLDPAPGEDAVAIQFDDREAYRAAYHVFLQPASGLDPLDAVGGEDFVGFEIDRDVYLGVDRKVLSAIASPRLAAGDGFADGAGGFLGMLAERGAYYEERRDSVVSVGSDGIVLIDRSRGVD